MFALAVALLAGAGCAHEYGYWPMDQSGNGPAARTPIPPEAPRGEVYVTSFGFTSMDVAPGQSDQVLHARLVAVNKGPDAWTIDGREQRMQVAPDRPALPPAFANTDAGAGPIYTVPPGRQRVFDFYYQVPPPLNDPRALSFFELQWRVNVSGQPIAERTPFQRFEDRSGEGAYDAYPDSVYVGLGWGASWWYGPGFPYASPPVIRGYYYPPMHARTYGPTWSGVPRGAPSPSPTWRGSPVPPSSGGWHGAPMGRSGGAPRAAPSGGGWHGSPHR